MNAPKFTPGPWEVDDQGDSFHVREEGASKHVIAHMNYAARSSRAISENIEAFEEQRANARLGAAAPKLYAALESLVHAVEAARWPLTAEQMALLNTARAALAKAVTP